MKVGSQARLIQPEVRGEVIARRIDESTDEIELLLQWTDAAGDQHQRWFTAAQLEEATQ